MDFRWTADTIRWFQAADNYTGFSRKMAERIVPLLKNHTSFCDIGCGLGLIDLELCQYIKKITCIDISGKAVESLQRKIEEKKITNIETLQMDSKENKDSWDVIFVSFYDSYNLEQYLPRCKRLIAVVGKNKKSELFPEKYRDIIKYAADETEKYLIHKNIPYTPFEASFEFGQPLVSLEDAENFVRTYSHGIDQKDLGIYLSQNLTTTTDKQYPYFLPRLKRVEIFDIKGELW